MLGTIGTFVSDGSLRSSHENASSDTDSGHFICRKLRVTSASRAGSLSNAPQFTQWQSIQRKTARMTLRRFINTLFRTAAAFGLATVSWAAEPLVTNVSRFEIPFDLDLAAGQRAEGFAVLFGSTDGGRTWDQLQSVPAGAQGFPFSAQRDGLYAFAVRMTDSTGNLQAPVPGAPAELEILVDTVAPELRLELRPGGGDQALVSWHSTDAAADPRSFQLEYSDGTSGHWQRADVDPAASGQTRLTAEPGTVLIVRGSIRDTAGNRGESTGQLVLDAIVPDTLGRPVVSGTASAAGLPIGPSPFPENANAAAPSFSSTLPTPAAVTQPDAGQIPHANSEAVGGETVATGWANSTSLGTPAVPVQSQLLSNRVFDLSYQVDDVGPSGVSVVELFVTEDGGQQWFRYGDDSDLKSPFQVDVQGEGTFGFAVRVHNGLGFADPPPQPGDSPDIVITVDQTAPQIQFQQPVVHADGSGTLSMHWQVSEYNTVAAPVRLEKSLSPTGPWTPVFDWQTDQSSYEWPIQAGTPASLYFRLLARDGAGNVASATTPQPVLIDLKRPVARLVGARVAQSARPRGFE
jgi:hypothetical protein